ncbi:putative secreted protein [Wickerhamomyces ciferrii]|uniref:Secreted protein n=1 Tax=Wickerhamomyces ciferrii (strain ATCC 14091 / BCRC 22168 / CBS 111 / JCM 3599 / NBRC 0793 / NRRL Y-1031 F-60-10) TaxID=1206466 RepID=K0KEN9_WICCF|nr:uncharacterized protein BN7_221 [Wickerhamomyces ciferrii]CCH40687.1 putative secreted protein [Wickerhamomyces ciferrii]
MKFTTVFSALTLPFLVSAQAQGLYSKDLNVFELDTTNFNQVVMESNQTTIVEFYAPWCGHCRQLKPHYSKAAKQLKDIVQVGAVNCDYAKNKNLCSKYKIEGYPTIMGFRPPKVNLDKVENLKYTHATEKYSGARTAKGIVDFGLGRIKNYVKRIATEDKLNEWLNKSSPRPKTVVFTRKDKLAPLLKSIAIDLLGIVDIAYFPLRDREVGIFEKYDIDPKGDKAVVFYFDSKTNEPIRNTSGLSKLELFKFYQQFNEIQSQLDEVLEKSEYLNKVQKGEKITKKSKKNGKKSKSDTLDHDEL